jgi:hypothetical protein
LQGYSFAAQHGHTIIPPVPSLFTFKIANKRLADLSGVMIHQYFSTITYLMLTRSHGLTDWKKITLPLFLLSCRLRSPESRQNWCWIAFRKALLNWLRWVATFRNSLHICLLTLIAWLLQTGPLLVTHWGLSGPVVLRLSAWGAREIYQDKYQGGLNKKLYRNGTRSQLTTWEMAPWMYY